jgi:dihydrofolate reductase
MAHITAELFCTLNGVVSSPQDWHGPYWTNDAGERTERLLEDSEVMLLGRNTYLEHAEYWPTDAGSMADLMNGIPKLVVSATLDAVDWASSRLAGEGLDSALAELGDARTVVTGSVALVRSLIAAGELDELRLIVDPVIVANGTRLFDDAPDRSLRLVESIPSSTGAVTLQYAFA